MFDQKKSIIFAVLKNSIQWHTLPFLNNVLPTLFCNLTCILVIAFMCFSLIKFELNYKLKDYDKFLYFYEHSQSGIVIFDSEFKVEFSNKTSLELLGENINKSIPDSLRAKMYQNFKEKSSFESDLGTVVINSQDLEFSSKTLVYNNEIYLSVSIKNNTKNQTLIGLSKTKAFRDISLASLMHKNRATLQAILDLTKQIILKEIGMSSSLIKKLKIIRLSSAILLNSCSNFIDFSFSKYTVSKSDVKIRQVLEDVVNKFKIQEKIMNVELDLKFDPLIDEIVNSETKRIKQILINLIHNSFKYINKGKIEVSASITTDNHIKIIVKDTGIGIKQDKLEEIRASLRGENINKNNMSLYVSNQHAINLGGRGLEIESSKIIGTKVSFWIDIGKCDDVSKSSSIDELFFKFPKISLGSEILIVDDTDFNRYVLKSLINEHNMTCIEAKNGKEAVDLVLEASQNNRPFKVIIMDCQMPEMDGWEASRCIKSLHASLLIDKMPDIIGYTTFTSKEDIQKCFDSGMSHYISKPAACSVIMQQIIKSLNSNNLKLA